MDKLISDIHSYLERYDHTTEVLGRLSSEFYQSEFQTDKSCSLYVREHRGVGDEMIDRFGIGYGSTPKKFTKWLSTAFGESELDILLHTGVLKPVSEGVVDHFFEQRVVFPIKDLEGKVTAFYSNILPLSSFTPRYKGSPLSTVYRKHMTLFGLYQAYESIQSKGYALLVEGIFDVISLHQVGITWAVAPCGTAFTKEQALILKHFGKSVVSWFDSDDAGKRATKKAELLCVELDIEYRSVTMEEYKDPDEALKQCDPQIIMDTLQL